MVAARTSRLLMLDVERIGPEARQFQAGLRDRVIGQDSAIQSLVSIYQAFKVGMTNPSRPLGTLLFLGPTGSGKTRVVESAAEVLFGDSNAIVKIDCAEFQHSHEIASLVGSPPGYLGHRETLPLLAQENLDANRTVRDPFTIVLFDEIEKASDALWQLLLGVLDKGTLRLGDNRPVDFSQTMIVMTSNLGAREMSELVTGSIGFAPPRGSGIAPAEAALPKDELAQKIYHTASEAARRKFLPEFMNRIDRVVVFRSLKPEDLSGILDVELALVQRRIDKGASARFRLVLTDQAKQFLLSQGIEPRYGARHLKRAIEQHLVVPLASLSATRQVLPGDSLLADFEEGGQHLSFYRVEDAPRPEPVSGSPRSVPAFRRQSPLAA